MYPSYDDVYALTETQQRALQALTRQFLDQVITLQRAMETQAAAAGIDDDVVLDHLTGDLQLAEDRARRLNYYLRTH